MTPINLSDYEKLAEERIEPGAWGYYQGGSDDEVTLRECRAAFQRIKLRPRMLVDVRTIDMHTTVLGTPINLPVLVAPTAYHCMAHPEGECATAVGTGLADTIMIASSFSNRSLEEIASVATKPLWFQLYSYRDLQSTGKVVQRAEAAGYKALVLTADFHVWAIASGIFVANSYCHLTCSSPIIRMLRRMMTTFPCQHISRGTL